jgi:hypothetical protein
MLNLYGSRIRKKQEKALNFFAERLFSSQMIGNLHIRVKFVSNSNDHGAVYVDDYNVIGQPRYFIMEIAKEDSLNTQIQTMAHEMVHIRQFVRNEINEELTKWKSRRVNSDVVPYKDLPWEIEANKLGDRMYEEFVESCG